jgi:hypothetical protein
MSYTEYNDEQVNAISVITAKYEYLSTLLKALAGTTEALEHLHRIRLEVGWNPSDALLAEAHEIEWRGLKMKYLEALESNSDLNKSMFVSRVEMWMN